MIFSLYIAIGIYFVLVLLRIIHCIISYEKSSSLIQSNKDHELLSTVTQLNRGTLSERDLILYLLKHNFPSITIFHDLYIKRNDSDYTQIDVVVATKIGIIVFEVKDYKGYIYGNGLHKYWIQIPKFGGRQYKFYNPIRQNNMHRQVLKRALRDCANIPYYSIIVFYGKCRLKIRSIPQGSYVVSFDQLSFLLKQIFTENPIANYTDKRAVVNRLREAVENGNNILIREQHNQYTQNIQHKNEGNYIQFHTSSERESATSNTLRRAFSEPQIKLKGHSEGVSPDGAIRP